MSEQIKRLPKIAIWHDKDMIISFLVGVVLASIINWIFL